MNLHNLSCIVNAANETLKNKGYLKITERKIEFIDIITENSIRITFIDSSVLNLDVELKEVKKDE